jgi:hypothetical protein
LELRQELFDSTAQQVRVEVSNQNFLRNNEYFHEMLTGYTLFGSLLQARIAYQANANWKLSGGIFLRKDFGHAGFYAIEPLLSLKYQRNGLGMIFGNLEGNFNHRLIEPLYHYERYITQHPENGLQFLVNRTKWWSDTWIHWEVMQYNRSNYQEQFTGGHVTYYTLLKRQQHELKAIGQGLISHRGGQIDVDTNAMQSRLSAALGFEYTYRLNGWLREIKTQNYILYSSLLNAPKSDRYHSGNSFYLNVLLNTRYHAGLSFSYWQGNDFLSSRGGDLFQSISSPYTQKVVTDNHRKLLIARLYYQKQLTKDLYADVRAEPYYDLGRSFLEYAYGFYLTYKKDFVLLNEKNHQKK